MITADRSTRGFTITQLHDEGVLGKETGVTFLNCGLGVSMFPALDLDYSARGRFRVN